MYPRDKTLHNCEGWSEKTAVFVSGAAAQRQQADCWKACDAKWGKQEQTGACED